MGKCYENNEINDGVFGEGDCFGLGSKIYSLFSFSFSLFFFVKMALPKGNTFLMNSNKLNL